MNVININIDRHILSGVMDYRDRKKKDFIEFAEQWKVLCDLSSTGDLLYWTECTDEGKKECDLKETRKKFFRALERIGRIALRVQSYDDKEEALLMHLVSEIKKVEQDKGGE